MPQPLPVQTVLKNFLSLFSLSLFSLLLFCFLPLFSEVIAEEKPASTGALKILCYNIHHGRGLDGEVDLERIAAVILQKQPDLVALQEVDKNTNRTGQTDQSAILAKLTGMHSLFGKQIEFQGGEYGQALLSRFPLRDAQVHLLPGLPNTEQRIVLSANLEVAGKTLTFATTHLDHMNAEIRNQQTNKLNEIFADWAFPVILAGDFNATPQSAPLKILEQQWSCATSAPEFLTFPANAPNRQLDYIFFRPQQHYKSQSAQVLSAPRESDHLPIFVELLPK